MKKPAAPREDLNAPTDTGHLSPEALRDFLEGTLPAGEDSRVQQHLAACASCRSRLEALERGEVPDTQPARPKAASGPKAGASGPKAGASGPKAGPQGANVNELPPDAQVGRYRVERLLGAGGMGRVLLAHDPELDRRVAIKLLKPHHSAAPELEARLLREARAMARLSHPNVVTVHDVGTWNNQVFLAMEYVEGGTLSDWLAEPRSVRQVVDVFRLAGMGLSAAHKAGLVHRDFKPDNVLIGKDGSVRVNDFGLVRAAESPDEAAAASTANSGPLDMVLTIDGAVMGTPAYMSPEQHEGRPTDARTDQFSFCAALYLALYGRRPFPGSGLESLRMAVIDGRVRVPPKGGRVPDAVRDVVLRGLSVDPDKRFASMDALLAALARATEGNDGRAQGVRGWAFGGAATLLVLLLSTTQVWRGFEERAQGLLSAARPRPWSDEVVLVAVDQASLRALGWPAPRQLQARVLTALAAAGVKAVGYDIFFSSLAVDGAVGDESLASILRTYGRAVLAMACTVDAGGPPEEVGPRLASSAVPDGAAPAAPCEGLVMPVEPLRKSAPLAQVETAVSASGNIRGVYALTEVAGKRLPTLALSMLSLGEQLPFSTAAQSARGLHLGAHAVPLDETGALLASFRLPTDDQVITFRELAAALPASGPAVFPEELAARLRGRYVLVGNTAEGSRDLGPLANGQHLPLVLLHGALLADLLENRPVRAVPHAVEMLAILAFGALLTGVALRLRPLLSALALVVAVQGIVGGALLLAEAGYAAGPLGPSTAAVLAFALVFAARATTEERAKRRVRGALNTYLSAATLRQVLRDPKKALSLEGARARVSVLSAVLRGPHEEERLPPEEAIALRRARLQAMTAKVLAREGRVESLRGDGLVAVFGEPLPSADHARRAVTVALEIQRALEEAADVSVGVGVATGPVLVGNVGPMEGRIEYAVVGAAVEQSAELARRAPTGAVLVSGETRADCAEAFTFQRTPEESSRVPAYEVWARR